MSWSFKLWLSMPPLLWTFSKRWLCVIKKLASKVECTITALVCRRPVPPFSSVTAVSPAFCDSLTVTTLALNRRYRIVKARAQLHFSLNSAFFLHEGRRGGGLGKLQVVGQKPCHGGKITHSLAISECGKQKGL